MNYRDLQNISNLSQEILIEGANEEHNVLNRWPYTSPYLQEDYNQEAYVPWDFGPKQKAKEKHTELAARKEAGGSAPGTATRANRIASTAREMRTTLDQDSAMTMTNPKKQGLQPSTPRHTAAAVRGAGGGTTARTKFDVKPLKPASKGPKGGGSSVQGVGSPSGTGRYQVGGGQGYGISGIKLADSYDLYDIILSHLLDEGYAETLEQAEVIMVNMSENWRESIFEGVVGEFADKVASTAGSVVGTAQRAAREIPKYVKQKVDNVAGSYEYARQKANANAPSGGMTTNPRSREFSHGNQGGKPGSTKNPGPNFGRG